MSDHETEIATFGAGCFWGVEEVFRQMPGVLKTEVGYEGGTKENPTYKEVCTDTTGHAEVVRVTFDPAQISYEELLAKFFALHDPTQLNRQGPDYGKQYRSVVLYHGEAQRLAAEAMKKAVGESGIYSKPIATAIEPSTTFYIAEEYHQQYLAKRGLGSCHI